MVWMSTLSFVVLSNCFVVVSSLVTSGLGCGLTSFILRSRLAKFE